MWKEWMLKFEWKKTGERDTFYFDTKEEMMKFVRGTDDIRITAMFHLEKIS